MESVEFVAKWFLLGLIGVVIGYALVRAMSWAYFRTKLEYFRSVLREASKGRNDEK